MIIRVMVVVSQDHDIVMRGRGIDVVLLSADVVCSIVDTHEVMTIDAVVFE